MFLNFIVPLVFIIFYNFSFVCFSKKAFGKTLPISFSAMTLTLFFSQIFFHTFQVGVVVNCIVALYWPVYCITKNNFRELKGKLFSGGFIAFITIYVLFWIIDYNRILKVWDELMHWGPFVKEMYRLDRFYSEPYSLVVAHKDYPPFISLFQLLWCKLCGNFSDMNISLAFHVLEFGTLIPYIVEKVNVGNKLKKIAKVYLILFGTIFLFVIFDVGNIFNTIYTDYYIIVLFVLGFDIILQDDFFDNWQKLGFFLIIEITLVMSKQISLAYIVILWFAIGIKTILKIKCIKKHLNVKQSKKAMKFILIILLPILFYFLWNNIVKDINTDKQFDIEKEGIIEIVQEVFNHSLSGEREIFISNYIKQINNFSLVNSFIPISYLSYTILLFFVMIGLGGYIYKSKSKYNVDYITIFLSFFVGTIWYALGICMMYLLFFSEVERTSVMCFDRYMSSYILGETYIAIIFWAKIISEKEFINMKIYAIIIGLVMIFVNFNQYKKLLPNCLFENDYQKYVDIAKEINQTIPENSNILLVSREAWREKIFLYYYILPREITAIEKDNYQSWMKSEYDYVLILDHEESN